MDTLLIGNSSIFSKKSIQELFASGKDDTCIVCSQDFPEKRSGRVRYLSQPEDLRGYEFLFEKNHFDTVVCISEFLTPDRTPFHEVENVGAALSAATEHAIKNSRFLYVIPSIRIEGNEENDFASMCLSASLSLFMHYEKEFSGKISFAVLRTPFVIGSLEKGDYLDRLFQVAGESQELTLPWPVNAQLPLLCEQDLSDFLHRFLDLWDGVCTDIVLNPFREQNRDAATVSAFAKALSETTGKDVISAPEGDDSILVTVREEESTARNSYGWYAMTNPCTKVSFFYQEYEIRHPKMGKHFLPSLHIPKKLLTLIELAVGTVITQILIYISGNSVQFRMIDYRLLFVVITATMYGSRTGFVSALLMSISLFYSYRENSITGTMLLYDPGNWIPFILLFGVSAVCGYTGQTLRDRIAILQKDREELSKENSALTALYDDASRSRDRYRQDLMMSQNSFGEIFEVVQKLNSLHPNAIYSSAVPIFEKILDTDSVAIYDISDRSGTYARLEVCSSQKKEHFPRSIRLDERPEIMEELRNGRIWINREAAPKLPNYVAGAFDEDGKTAVMVLIDDIPFDRMSGYFANIVRVLAGIMQSFLLRAFHYTKQQKLRYYYPGTILMHEDAFAGKFRQVKDAAEDGITSWRLLEIDGEGKSASEWDRLLAGKVRTTDTVCYADDGNLYVLFNQVDEKTEKIVLKRYQGYGFSCRFVENIAAPRKEDA